MSLLVSEIFYSLQGEGRFVGQPSLFLRVAGCNLSCSGYGVNKDGNIGCDSIFAVDVSYKNEWQSYLDSTTLIDDLKKTLPNNKKFDIVLTGGEPLIFYKNSVLLETIRCFQEQGVLVTIETNATVEIDFEKYPEYKKCIFAMSVKLSNSGEIEKKRINKKAILAICKNSKDSFFKFVVDKKNINELEGEIFEITKGFENDIYCMPMGESQKTLKLNDKAVFEFCIKNGFCYSDRVHIRVWGKKTRV